MSHSLGPVIIDVAGFELSVAEIVRLRHPLVGGIILFSRNYQSVEQLQRLCQQVHELRDPALMIFVDQEGGRVQRFREGFTRLPAMRQIGQLWNQQPVAARTMATQLALVLGFELRKNGVDVTLAPVLDLDYGCSTVIGDRAFHRHHEAVIDLAQAFSGGLSKLAMPAIGKHYPGHGFAEADSHLAGVIDERSLAEILANDIQPYFSKLGGLLQGVMPAHVIYPAVDNKPAGFSAIWIQEILRQQIGFQGVVFSDDLTMAAAGVAGNIQQRTEAALAAGCDMVLVCNRPDLADELLAGLPLAALDVAPRLERIARLGQLCRAPSTVTEADYQLALGQLAALGELASNCSE